MPHTVRQPRDEPAITPHAEITAEPSHGGICLSITRRKTRRLWIGLDEVERVIAALQVHVAPVTVRTRDGG